MIQWKVDYALFLSNRYCVTHSCAIAMVKQYGVAGARRRLVVRSWIVDKISGGICGKPKNV